MTRFWHLFQRWDHLLNTLLLICLAVWAVSQYVAMDRMSTVQATQRIEANTEALKVQAEAIHTMQAVVTKNNTAIVNLGERVIRLEADADESRREIVRRLERIENILLEQSP